MSVEMQFALDKFCVDGSFAYEVGVKVTSVAFSGIDNPRGRRGLSRKGVCRSRTMAQAECYVYQLICR